MKIRRDRLPYLLALCFGLIFAWTQLGFDDPAEHYPTMESAGGLLFGYWSPPWEMPGGLRSWLQPLFLASVMKPFVLLGLRHRLILDSIARSALAFLSLGTVWAVGEMAEEKDRFRVRVAAAFAWPLLVWGTRHSADAFCVVPLMTGLAFFMRRQLAISAALFSIAFTAKYTAAAPIIIGTALHCALFGQWKRFWQVGLLTFVFSALLTGLDAAVCRFVFGQWKVPLLGFFGYNVAGKMGMYHQSPWWEMPLYFFLLWVPPLFFLAIPFSRQPGKIARWALLTALLSLVVLASAKHHELRFVFPILGLTLPASAALLRHRIAYRLALASSALILLTALLLYSKPHGGIVRGLVIANGVADDSTGLVFSEISTGTGVPAFYSERNLPFVFFNGPQWRQVCSGDFTVLDRMDLGHWDSFRTQPPLTSARPRRWAVIAQNACPPGPEESRCRLVQAIPPTLGDQLRARISNTGRPSFVYLCQ